MRKRNKEVTTEKLYSIPDDWKSEPIVFCIASGPSLLQSDVDVLKGRCKTIVVNNTVEKAPWADILYASDGEWWHMNKGVIGFTGTKITLHTAWDLVEGFSDLYPDIKVLENLGGPGLEFKHKDAICNGRNSGYCAINVAIHKGAKVIGLLGYDMRFGPNGEVHHHKDHVGRPNPGKGHFVTWLEHYERMANILAGTDIRIVNCTRRTALTMFPRSTLEETLDAYSL